MRWHDVPRHAFCKSGGALFSRACGVLVFLASFVEPVWAQPYRRFSRNILAVESGQCEGTLEDVRVD